MTSSIKRMIPGKVHNDIGTMSYRADSRYTDSLIASPERLTPIEMAVIQSLRRGESVVFIDTRCNTSGGTIDYDAISFENGGIYKMYDCTGQKELADNLSDDEILRIAAERTFIYIRLPLKRAEDYSPNNVRKEVEWVEHNIQNIRNRLIYELEYAQKNLDFICPVNIITDNLCILNWALGEKAGLYADITKMRRRRNIKCISVF